jgi:hypothetical protein
VENAISVDFLIQSPNSQTTKKLIALVKSHNYWVPFIYGGSNKKSDGKVNGTLK